MRTRNILLVALALALVTSLQAGSHQDAMCNIHVANYKKSLNQLKMGSMFKNVDGGTGMCTIAYQLVEDIENVNQYCAISKRNQRLEREAINFRELCEAKGMINWQTQYQRSQETPKQRMIGRMFGW